MTIKQWQSDVDKWITTYGVRYFDEMTNMVLLTEEVGELARLMARRYGEQSFKAHVPVEQVHTHIADEMADIIFVLSCLANQIGIDLEEALRLNLHKKTERDRDRHHKNPKL